MGGFGRLGRLGVRVGVAVGVGCLAFGAVGAPVAVAHPFGDPQTVVVGVDGADAAVVRVRWKVGGLDDLTLLGVSLGVLPQERVLLDGAVI